MCNLYQMTPKDDLVVYIRRMVGDQVELDLPDYEARPVGPFGTGLFLRPSAGGYRGELGQWGMIRKGQPGRIDHIAVKSAPGKPARAPRPRLTNNARIEDIERKPTFAPSWKDGKRCLVPAAWYQEPNWETGKNIWWQLRHVDGSPWMIAGLYDDTWFDKDSGELVPSYTVITCNCTGHPLLGRLHKPDIDPKTGDPLPDEEQDKRSLIHIGPEHWEQWLHGSEDEARALLVPQASDAFDQSDARRTDEALAKLRPDPQLF